MSSFPDILLGWDRELLLLLNGSFSHPALDSICRFFNDPGIPGVLLIAVLLTAIIIRGGATGFRTVLFVVLAVAFSDSFNSQILKEIFHRLRPCHEDIEGLRVLVHCGKGASFPSSHAANNFAAAFFLSVRIRKGAPFFLALALAVSASRVYAGVHYPLDVASGCLVGAATAFMALYLENLYVNKFQRSDRPGADPRG